MKKKNSFDLWKGLIAITLWVFSLGMFAQNVTVTGTVTDVTGEPLIGVTIQVEGTSVGTVTDYDGKYSLPNISPNGTLEVSYVGMKTQKVAIGGRTLINISLSEDSEMLSEVVVTGFGMSQRKESLTSAISVIGAKDLSR